MKSTTRFFILGLLAASAFGLSGCVSPTTVDYDRAAIARIAGYECFVIDPREVRANYQDVVLSPIVDRRIENALEAELKARGYQSGCPQPDFRVAFNTITQTRSEINELGVGGAHFRRYPLFGYSGFGHLELDEYEEGTIVVDIIDASSEELVWRGAYVQRLGWSAPDDQEVRRIIATILSEFPPESEDPS